MKRQTRQKLQRGVVAFFVDLIAFLLRLGTWSGLRKGRIGHSAPRRITVLSFQGLRSLVYMISALQHLRRQYPLARLTLVTTQDAGEFAALLPFVDRVLALDLQTPQGLLASLVRMVLYHLRRPAELLFDTELSGDVSALIAHLMRAHWRIGFRGAERRNQLYDHTVTVERRTHVELDYLRLVGASRAVLEPCVIRSVAANAVRLGEGTWVGVHIGAGAHSHEWRWPSQHFLEFLLLVANEYPELRFFLLGSSEDLPYVKRFCRKIPESLRVRFVNGAGRTSLKRSLAILPQLKLVISCDSGLVALAAYFGVPTVSFWGPESPQRFGPVRVEDSLENRANHVMLSLQLPCSPCQADENHKAPPCHGDNVCMKRMLPAWAWGRTRELCERLGFKKTAA